MPRIHPYGEPRTEDSPLTEFFCWLFMIGLALPLSYGWVLVNLGWISNTTLFEACGALGVVIGLKAAINTARHKRKKLKDAASTPPLHTEGGKVVLLNPPDKIAHFQEGFAEAQTSEKRGYESR